MRRIERSETIITRGDVGRLNVGLSRRIGHEACNDHSMHSCHWRTWMGGAASGVAVNVRMTDIGACQEEDAFLRCY